MLLAFKLLFVNISPITETVLELNNILVLPLHDNIAFE